MEAEELDFLKIWEAKRKRWKWGKVFVNTILYFALPIVVTIDFVNFFIIADTSFGFFSFAHLWQFIQTLLIFSLIMGSGFGIFYWYSNEIKFQRLLRKQENERKSNIKNNRL